MEIELRRMEETLGEIEIDRTNDLIGWTQKIKKFLDNSLEVFGYFSKYYSGYPPADAKQLLKLLGRRDRD